MSENEPQPSGPFQSAGIPYVVLTGNPNCGKTTLFNALTGLRAKVGNYPGVTVERKEGRLKDSETPVQILDLPGTYSLSPQSLDEQVARDVLFHRVPEVPPPAIVVVVVDASNLQRNLYFASQVIELGYPTILALNMVDVALANGQTIDALQLSKALGIPVVPLVASAGTGLSDLRQTIVRSLRSPCSRPKLLCILPGPLEREAQDLASRLQALFPETRYHALAEAILVLSDEKMLGGTPGRYPAGFVEAVAQARRRLMDQGIDWRSAAIEARYVRIAATEQQVTTFVAVEGDSITDRLDRVLTHRFWGVIIFVVLMALMFQTIFSFAKVPMDWVQMGVDWVGGLVGGQLPPGPFSELIELGVFKGAGAVVVFLPQICLLFFFIGLLEDTGYMSRAAFLMDRLMSKVGLHGKSFIPMLSSFACAIPGIMATRTIESPKDRLVTILVSPLMSCSARLPVYTVLIAACIPNTTLFGVLKLPGLVMLGMYLLGIVVALLMAWLFKRTLLKAPTPMLILELPPYKCPLFRVVARHMWDRARLFLRRAGTVILGINILLWFLASYPKHSQVEETFSRRREALAATPATTETERRVLNERLQLLDREESGERLRGSFAGMLGQALEPLIRPLGFDWKIGIGIVASFAAREVFVSTMSLVYNVGEIRDKEAGMQSLAQTMQEQKDKDGKSLYRPRVALALMVFYVFALQCISTVAVVRRETNGWKWPLFQWIYMGVLAWTLSWVTYQVCPWFGLL